MIVVAVFKQWACHTRTHTCTRKCALKRNARRRPAQLFGLQLERQQRVDEVLPRWAGEPVFSAVFYGAGGDHGIVHDKKWLRFPYVFIFWARSQYYLHPYPYYLFGSCSWLLVDAFRVQPMRGLLGQADGCVGGACVLPAFRRHRRSLRSSPWHSRSALPLPWPGKASSALSPSVVQHVWPFGWCRWPPI
eukprot:COSAG01_NODE_16617_length_1220_cov_2.398029_2_plen_190_part_00